VTFVVFFAGVCGQNAAGAVTGALLVYVLPAASPGTVSMIPDRLAGWWLASVVGTIAVLALPTPAVGDRLRVALAKLARSLASALETALYGEPTDAQLAAAAEAKRQLLATVATTPFRPTGQAIRERALANAVEQLEWCTALVADAIREQVSLGEAPHSDRDLFGDSAAVLRDSAALLLDSGSRLPDLDSLDDRQRESLSAARSGWRERPARDDDTRVSFHAHTIATAALAVGEDALLAARRTEPDQTAMARAHWLDGEELTRLGPRAALGRYTGTAISHASVRSVWFVNSLRGALALAAAVAVADATSVQHGFWVVLGTLSVLRTNAGATGATALRALLGTAIGFVVGGALLVAIGASSTALWIVLPVAVLVAAYAPGTAPFAVGQAAFTVTVAVLFNLLVPVGWKVGEVRIEDVAIGCLVSVVVGALFWPRGVASVAADDLADAYRIGADYLREAIAWARGLRGDPPVGGRAVMTAGLRLDAAVRGFLAEQGTKHLQREELWRLIGGTLRLRQTASSVAELPRACIGTDQASFDAIEQRADALLAWYDRLAAHIGRPRGGVTPLAAPPNVGDGASDGGGSRGAIWLREYLEHLAQNTEVLTTPAMHVAEIRRRPWWR
jgi:uncharacterized membrane protein YccC